MINGQNPIDQWLNPNDQWLNPNDQWLNPNDQWLNPNDQWLNPNDQWLNHVKSHYPHSKPRALPPQKKKADCPAGHGTAGATMVLQEAGLQAVDLWGSR